MPETARRPRWWLELIAIAWLAWVYDLTTNLASFRQHAAIDHGAEILRAEQTVHLDPERAMDAWLKLHPLLGLWAGDYYDNAHFIVTFVVIGWLWWRHPRVYRPLRTALVLVNVVGFVVFLAWPVAPPRLVPVAHVADIVALTGAFGGWHAGVLAHEANQFASMPSLHLGWATWCAWAAWRVWRHHRLAPLVWLYPLLTTVVVLATGNHFFFDCIGGTLTAAACILGSDALYRRLGRRRRPPPSVVPSTVPPSPAVASRRPAAASSARTGVVRTPTAGKAAHTTNAQA